MLPVSFIQSQALGTICRKKPDNNTLNNLYDEKVLVFTDSTLVYTSIDDRSIGDVRSLCCAAPTGSVLQTPGYKEMTREKIGKFNKRLSI